MSMVTEAMVEALRILHRSEHAKLGELLIDKSNEGVSAANWQGGKVNGIAAAIEALGATGDGRNWVVNGRFDPNSGNFDGISFAGAALSETKPGRD